MPPLGLPKLSADPVLFVPFWTGSYNDKSVLGRTATPTNISTWSTLGNIDAIKPSTGSSYIDYTASAEITDFTIFVAGDFIEHLAGKYILDVAGQTYLATFSGVTRLFTGGTLSGIATTIDGNKSLAVSSSATSAKPKFYLDGVYIGEFATAVSASIPSSTVSLFGRAGRNSYEQDTSVFLIYPSVLSAPEVLTLHTWSQTLITPRKQWPGAGLQYAGGVSTGDPIYVDSIQTARVSLANETAGQLSNTGMTIVSGTWAITESAAGRAITCVVAGQLRGSAQGASAATTKLFTQTGGVVLTKNAADFTLDATAGDTVTALQLTAP
jgi:hypothetical protein